MRSDEYQSQMLALRIMSLAFVLGHEIGHHVHRDYTRVSDAKQQKREAKADQYSLQLMLKAGFSPLAALPVMVFFGEAGSDVQHPPPECRMANFILQGFPAMMADPNFAKYLNDHPDAKNEFAEYKSEVAADRPEMQSKCGQWLVPSP
jgi:Zn-dependent protease with chaperone function